MSYRSHRSVCVITAAMFITMLMRSRVQRRRGRISLIVTMATNLSAVLELDVGVGGHCFCQNNAERTDSLTVIYLVSF